MFNKELWCPESNKKREIFIVLIVQIFKKITGIIQVLNFFQCKIQKILYISFVKCKISNNVWLEKDSLASGRAGLPNSETGRSCQEVPVRSRVVICADFSLYVPDSFLYHFSVMIIDLLPVKLWIIYL